MYTTPYFGFAPGSMMAPPANKAPVIPVFQTQGSGGGRPISGQSQQPQQPGGLSSMLSSPQGLMQAASLLKNLSGSGPSSLPSGWFSSPSAAQSFAAQNGVQFGPDAYYGSGMFSTPGAAENFATTQGVNWAPAASSGAGAPSVDLGLGSGGGAGGGAGLGAFGTPLAIAAAIGAGKTVEHNNANNPLGRGLLSMLGPDFNQIKADPKLGLTTAFGLPFLNGFIRNQKAANAKPEWDIFG